MDMVTQSEFSITIAGTFSGNPITLAAGDAMLGYLMRTSKSMASLSRKANIYGMGSMNTWRRRGCPHV